MNVIYGVLLAVCLTGCAASPLSAGAGSAEAPPGGPDALPQEVRDAPGAVQEAYRYAVANPELLKTIPCYCGCEVVQHRSNYDCYVAEVLPDGSVLYSDHGLG